MLLKGIETGSFNKFFDSSGDNNICQHYLQPALQLAMCNQIKNNPNKNHWDAPAYQLSAKTTISFLVDYWRANQFDNASATNGADRAIGVAPVTDHPNELLIKLKTNVSNIMKYDYLSYWRVAKSRRATAKEVLEQINTAHSSLAIAQLLLGNLSKIFENDNKTAAQRRKVKSWLNWQHWKQWHSKGYSRLVDCLIVCLRYSLANALFVGQQSTVNEAGTYFNSLLDLYNGLLASISQQLGLDTSVQSANQVQDLAPVTLSPKERLENALQNGQTVKQAVQRAKCKGNLRVQYGLFEAIDDMVQATNVTPTQSTAH